MVKIQNAIAEDWLNEKFWNFHKWCVSCKRMHSNVFKKIGQNFLNFFSLWKFQKIWGRGVARPIFFFNTFVRPLSVTYNFFKVRKWVQHAQKKEIWKKTLMFQQPRTTITFSSRHSWRNSTHRSRASYEFDALLFRHIHRRCLLFFDLRKHCKKWIERFF